MKPSEYLRPTSFSLHCETRTVRHPSTGELDNIYISGLPEDNSGDLKILKVQVIGGRGLAKKDIFGLSDPYCTIKLLETRGQETQEITTLQTSIHKKTLNPEWNSAFYLRVKNEHDLLFEIFDENRLTRDDFLGEAQIELSAGNIVTEDDYEFSNNPAAVKDYLLQKRSQRSRVKGHIRIYLSYVVEDEVANDDDSHMDVGVERDGFAARHIANDFARLESEVVAPAPEPTLDYPPRDYRQESIASEPGFVTVSVDNEDVITDDDAFSAQPTNNHTIIQHSLSREEERHEEPLPGHWEERQDANGRRFYLNHLTRTTSWHRPTVAQAEREMHMQEVNEQMSRGFQIRRHISVEDGAAGQLSATADTVSIASRDSGTPAAITEEEEDDQLPPGWEVRQDGSGRTFYINHDTRSTQWSRPTSLTRRPTERETAPTEEEARAATQNETSTGSERLHPDVPSPAEMPLPAGWAMQLNENGRIFFIDHNTRQTSWVDPRINNNVQNEPELGPLPPGWEERVHADGRKFFIDHDTQSTQWEDPRLQLQAKKKTEALPYSRDYKRKYDFFRSRLKKPEGVPNKYEIHVRRNNILEDSYKFVLVQCPKVDILKTKLWIVFDEETGLDYGGLSREWFYLLSKEVFNPYYGLFEYSATDNYTLQLNPNSGLCNDQHLSYFKFIGRVAGMAVYHGKLLDAFFIRPFYKMMLGKKITLQDMESVDSEYYNSLQWLLENDPEVLMLTFTVEEEVFGELVSHELKEGGNDISVTDENKQEYIDLVIKWRFVDRIKIQMDSFMKGFEEIIPQNLAQVFDEKELEYLLCGLGEIDVDDWRKNTQYRGGYHDKHTVVQWFWKAVATLDNEMKARLLQFVTGTSRVPMNGFAELYGSNGPQKFAVERWGNAHQLPRAHTCFNRIDLPPYSSYHELREKLRLAIENTEGFEGVD